MSRVDRLVQYLKGSFRSLPWACRALGFSRNDLTSTEEEKLFERIFQCDGCSIWYDIDECGGDGPYGVLCEGCCDDLEEDEQYQ